jgi:hypothetical protein
MTSSLRWLRRSLLEWTKRGTFGRTCSFGATPLFAITSSNAALLASTQGRRRVAVSNDPNLGYKAARQKIPGHKIALIMAKGAMSTAEPDGRSVQAVDSPNPDIDVMDFLRVGELLRKEVGWEDSYPARPNTYD